MRSPSAVLLLATSVAAAASLVPRGVAQSKAGRYTKPNNGDTFACSEGEVTVPFSAINDGYCDCPGKHRQSDGLPRLHTADDPSHRPLL